MIKPYLNYLPALLAGTCGAVLFYFLHLPMPWLLGAILGVLIAARVPGVKIIKPVKLANPVRVILGISVGSAFSPALLDEINSYLVSLAILVPTVMLFVLVGFVYFRRVGRLDTQTAYFSALPGGMLEIVAICEAYGGHVRRVMLIQTTRVLLIVYSVPFFIHHWGGIDLSGRSRIAQEISATPFDQMIILLIVGVAGWFAMSRTGLAGSSIIGPMVASAIVYSAGWVDARVPDELINFAQLALGAGVGATFVGITKKEVAQSLGMAVGYYGILMLISLVVAIGLSWFTDIPFIATLLAYVPGGQAEMNVVALVVGIAVPYIALHHILRMFLVMSIAPLLLKFVVTKNGIRRSRS